MAVMKQHRRRLSMIPRIIHQTWKVEQVPERWLRFQQSWRDKHPDHEYRLWTDAANREFIALTFPDFLSAYDGYRLPINRADLARYLIVQHYGGIYVDMDFEALRSLDDLLAGHDLVFGLEPQSHLNRPSTKARGLSRIVCNALFASAPRHQFWDHFLPMLLDAKDEKNVLDVAGPFILTRACDTYSCPQDISLVPAPLLYPVDYYGRNAADPSLGAPYAVHHWAGTWWREMVLGDAWRRIVAKRTSGEPNEER
jgi:mannosyltransferase OCH1-like enzyme